MVNGQDVTSMRSWRIPHFRRSIGCVFQDFRLLPNRTAYENVAFALEVIGKTKAVARRVVPEVLELVGLGGKEHRYPHELSGGEQQRVAVARAFVNRPLILLADEPTGNLDPDTSIEIMRLLDRINRTGTTVVMVTHDSNIVNQMRRRVIEIEGGKHRPRPGPRRLRLTLGPLPAERRHRPPRSSREGTHPMRLKYVLTEVAGRTVAQRHDDDRHDHHDVRLPDHARAPASCCTCRSTR